MGKSICEVRVECKWQCEKGNINRFKENMLACRKHSLQEKTDVSDYSTSMFNFENMFLCAEFRDFEHS